MSRIGIPRQSNIPTMHHCSRNHKYYGVRKTDFEESINAYVTSLKFNPDILTGLEATFLNKYRVREKEIVRASGRIHQNIADLEIEQASMIEAFTAARSPVIREKLEKEIDDLEKRIKSAGKERFKIQITRNDIKSFIKDARFIMEHPAEILLNISNIGAKRELFGLVFERMPTYYEIVNGTPKLACIFELSSAFVPTKNQLVTLRGIEPRFHP
jgi:hypothetical protein